MTGILHYSKEPTHSYECLEYTNTVETNLRVPIIGIWKYI